MAEAKTKEWPLILFTVGLQLAAGIELFAALALWRDPGTTSVRVLAIPMFPITAIALVISLFHLGKPVSAWRAFANLGQSKLSQEVAICSVFCAFAFSQFLLELGYGISSPKVVIASTIFGIAAVVSSARIYSIPGQLFWNSLWVPSSFIGSMLILGGVFASVAGVSNDSVVVLVVGTVVLVASSTVMLVKIRMICKHRYASPGSRPILQAKHWLIFCGSMIGVLAPIVGLIASHSSVPVAAATAVIALVGVALGRRLMYSRGIELAKF